MRFKTLGRRSRISLIVALIIIGISGTVIYLNGVKPDTNIYSPWGLMPTALGGREVSLVQAQSSVSFKINLPTNLGAFKQIKLDGQTVTIIYGVDNLPSSVTLQDVISQNGIIVLEMPNKMTIQDSAQNIRDAINATKNDPGGGGFNQYLSTDTWVTPVVTSGIP